MRLAQVSYLSPPRMAASQRPPRVGRRESSESDAPNGGQGKTAAQAKRPGRVERAMELRAFALKLLREQGLWQPLFNGPEVLRFEDSRIILMFYVKRLGPLELRERSGTAGLGSVWHGDKRIGKVLNLDWQTVGAVPRIVTFKRGEWEQWLLMS